MKNLIIFFVISFCIPNLAFPQEKFNDNSPFLSLTGKNCLAVNIGLLNNTAAVVNTTGAGASASTGFLGSFLYNHWVTDDWAIELNAGIVGAKAQSGVNSLGVEQSSAAVVPFLAGFRYYPMGFAMGNTVKPYIVVLVGAFNGYSSSNKVVFGSNIGSESKSQSVFGSKFGVGIDAFINSWMRVGLNTGFNLVSDFDEPVGQRKNYSGVEFSMSFGVVF